jgi:hypothetical protein
MKTSTVLAYQNQQVAASMKNMQPQVTGVASRLITSYNPALDHAATAALELHQNQSALASQMQQATSTVNSLAHAYGGQRNALGLLNIAGIKWGQLSSRNKEIQAEVRAQVQATADAMRAMGITGGRLGADEGALNKVTGDQWAAVTKLNQAWQTLIGTAQGVLTGFNGVIQGMRTVTRDASAAGASFTGVNNASVNLQDAFSQQIGTLQGVIGGMTQAHASARSIAEVFATGVKPAVDAGALANKGFRTTLYDMAQLAGYVGPDQNGPLTRFVNNAATSLRNAANAARDAASQIAALHSKSITVTTTFAYRQSGVGHAVAPGGYQAGIAAATAGLHLVGERGPELVMFAGGERVLSNPETTRFLANPATVPGGPLPGHAAGGTLEAVIHNHVTLDGEEIWSNMQTRSLQYGVRNGNPGAGTMAPPVAQL